MQTVDKAFELLGFFSEHNAELGLTELARRAEFDKATTRRLLLALAKHGHIEQDPETRRYRIGPGVIRLARLRELTLPVTAVVTPVLRTLTDQTGETSHFTLLSGWDLCTIAMCESSKANRVNMVQGESLPLHATASGIVTLAFLGSAGVDYVTGRTFESITEDTLVGHADILQALDKSRRTGFAISRGQYEADVCSIAAPVFDHSALPLGAIAVAAPASRFGRKQCALIRQLVTAAAADVTRSVGGRQPTGSNA